MRRRFGLILATRIDSLSIVYEARGGKPPSISAHSFFDLFVPALFSVCLMLLVGRREKTRRKTLFAKVSRAENCYFFLAPTFDTVSVTGCGSKRKSPMTSVTRY